MDGIEKIQTKDNAIQLLNIALEHEWAVSFEYIIHAYSMPKGKLFYLDPILETEMDARAQTIQIGIDEMYHSLQLGIIIKQLGGIPSFKTDEVIRFPKVIDNFFRDKKTEDIVTNLYQTAEFADGAFPKIQNMILNISYDEVRHAKQFEAMITSMKNEENEDSRCFPSDPDAANKEDVQTLHQIMRLENELLLRYLKYVIDFSEHQDLSQRLFKNSINHMRHWDKNAGILIKLGDVIQIENAEKDAHGVEKSINPMPAIYPGENRLHALETLIPTEKDLILLYEKLIPMIKNEEIEKQLNSHLALKREHLFTQKWLLENAKKVKGLK
jgi:bacterioferritin (cytochrome b1)